MFEWGHLFTWNEGPPTVLRLRGTEVARLSQKQTGEWHALLNQHLGVANPARVYRDCRSYETGKAGVDLWAERHRERLEREVAAVAGSRSGVTLGYAPKDQSR